MAPCARYTISNPSINNSPSLTPSPCHPLGDINNQQSAIPHQQFVHPSPPHHLTTFTNLTTLAAD